MVDRFGTNMMSVLGISRNFNWRPETMTNHKPSPSRQEKETACTEDKRQFGEVSQSIQSPWLMALHWRNNLQGKKAVLFLLGSAMHRAEKCFLRVSQFHSVEFRLITSHEGRDMDSALSEGTWSSYLADHVFSSGGISFHLGSQRRE